MFRISKLECAVDADSHLDVNQSVGNFLKYFESLSRLPLITDSEMDLLFGEEVKTALKVLERHGEQEKLCQNCTDRCCRLVNCKLYAPELSRCPIHSFRPLLCRMHFCNQFSPVYRMLVKELGDIFLESLLAAERIDRGKAELFDCPPLDKLTPELVDNILPLINEVKKGRLDEESALRLIRDKAEKCKIICHRI